MRQDGERLATGHNRTGTPEIMGMETLRLAVAANDLQSEVSRSSLRRAAAILRDGGTVAFPTETVYGLGANALNADAVAAIFQAKQRPRWDPLIVHIADEEMLGRVAADLPDAANLLRAKFWPGPLTLLLPRSQNVPALVTAGRDRIGVRMPSHPVALELIRLAGVPIAAPSANSFGHTSPTTAQHVLDDLAGRIDAVIDSGETTHGLESTVVDVCEDPPLIYRPGVITLEQIRALCPGTQLYEPPLSENQEQESLPSPGVGLRHYAPRAKLILLEGDQLPIGFRISYEHSVGRRRAGGTDASGRLSGCGSSCCCVPMGPMEQPGRTGTSTFRGVARTRCCERYGHPMSAACIHGDRDGHSRPPAKSRKINPTEHRTYFQGCASFALYRYLMLDL